MHILYFPCHSVLEDDEVSLFREMGHEVTVLPRGTKKHPIPKNFDLSIVVHRVHYLDNYFSAIQHRPILYRTIGQSVPATERKLAQWRGTNKVKIVRYSDTEHTIPNFAGTDAIIRFYKDPEVFKGWSLDNTEFACFNKKTKKRERHCHYDLIEKFCTKYNAVLYGRGNEDVTFVKTKEIPNEELPNTLANIRCLLYTGTFPASYTLTFIECLMTGIPIVAINEKLFYGNFGYYFGKTYEVPTILNNPGADIMQQCGFCVGEDYIGEMIDLLLNNNRVAKQISDNARKRAISLFGKEKIKKDWAKLFNDAV